MRGKLLWHQLVLFGVLFVVTAVRVISGRLAFGIDLLWWWLGGLLGFLFVFLDRLIYAMVSNPDEVMSVRVKDFIFKGHLLAGLALAFSERERQLRLMMRSALFVIVWVILSIFTATSTGLSFPRGMVLGIGTHLIFDLAWDYFGGSRNVEYWFWQIKKITRKEINLFVTFSMVFYFIIIWFL